MPRSPSDATRFTATGPYVSSNPTTTPTSSTRIKLDAFAPKNETPQQKIARLRAAAATNRHGKETQFDQVVRVGRRWADRAHRVTTISLIGLTAISAAVAVAGISDMIIHNRRRRNEWLAEQQAKTARLLAEAKVAQAAGMSLTEDQALAINRARAAMEADEAKRNRPGVFKKTTGWLFSSTSTAQGASSSVSTPGSQLPNEENNKTPSPILSSLEEIRPDGLTSVGQRNVRTHGGPLDQQAQFAFDSMFDASRAWMRRIKGQ